MTGPDTWANGLFTGKRAMITGGTKGLGLGIARKLAALGCDVELSFRSDASGARQALEALRALGIEARAHACDLAEDGAMDQLFEKLGPGPLDFYVHNAAATAFKPLMAIEPRHADKTLNLTVKSFIRGVQLAAERMPKGGAIVSVSGMDTLRAVPGHGLLGAAKSALETLTAYFAHELGWKGIRLNCVNPGFFESDSTRKYLGPAFDAVASRFVSVSPLGRAPTIDEIADSVVFLLSPASSWLVGQVLCVDGGQDFANPLAGDSASS